MASNVHKPMSQIEMELLKLATNHNFAKVQNMLVDSVYSGVNFANAVVVWKLSKKLICILSKLCLNAVARTLQPRMTSDVIVNKFLSLTSSAKNI